MEKIHTDLEIKVRGVIMDQQGRVLLSRLAKYGFWCLPGGTIEVPEAMKAGLKREFIEELNQEPIIGELVSVQEFFREDGKQVLDFWFWVKNPDDFKSLDLKGASHAFENDETAFIDLENFDGVFAPGNLPDMVKVWKKEGPKFIPGTGF